MKSVKEAVTTAVTEVKEAVTTAVTSSLGLGRGELTNLSGCPVPHNKNSLTAGPTGPVLVQDQFLIEKIQSFTKEKIPARNVHAVGYGAFGTFTATNPDIGKYTMAKIFQAGKKTPFVSRFSGVFTEQGEPDTSRDLRGFAMKFKTEDGVWDLLCINTPAFNCRDMKIGPDAVHAFKKDPRTGMSNPNSIFDFVAHHPEALHQTLMIFTDTVGTPASFRAQNWWAANTFSFVNSEMKRFFVRFHLVTDLNLEGISLIEARAIAGEDPSFLGRDLRDSINAGNYPKWRMCVQIMPEEQGYSNPFFFDCTKVWKHDDFPLIELGVIEVNENPIDYHTQVEQVAFSPARVVPGIGFSPDKLLQGRLLVYDEAQQYRIGVHFKYLPINCPLAINSNYNNGGPMNSVTSDKFPGYQGSSFATNEPMPNPKYMEPPFRVDGPAGYYDIPGEGTDEDYYGQARDFIRTMEPRVVEAMCYNLADELKKCKPEIVSLMMVHFNKIDPKIGTMITEMIDKALKGSAKSPSATVLDQVNSKKQKIQ